MASALEKAIKALGGFRTTGGTVLENARKEGYKFVSEEERLTLETVEEKAEDVLFLVEQRQAVIQAIAHADGHPKIREMLLKSKVGYDAQILELLRNSKVAARYKEIFDEHAKTLKDVLKVEKHAKNLQKADELAQEKQMLVDFFRRNGLDMDHESSQVLMKVQEDIDAILASDKPGSTEYTDAMRSMMAIRENRRVQFELRRYGFAETESRKQLIARVLPELRSGRPLFVQGEKGAGKTRFAEYICNRYLDFRKSEDKDKPKPSPYIMSLSAHTTVAEFKGRVQIEQGSSKFIKSEFLSALESGRPVIIDEVNFAPTGVVGIINEILTKKIGETWTHPDTKEEIVINAPIIFTGNMASKRYKDRTNIDPALGRRVNAVELHYHDIGTELDGRLIAPETTQILLARLANRNYRIDWMKGEPETCERDLNNFIYACRRIQEDFTHSVRESADHSSAARSTRMDLKENVITIEDQIRIIDAWKAGGFKESLEKVILDKFFKFKQLGSTYDQDNGKMIQIFIAHNLFMNLSAAEIGIPGIVTDDWLANLRNES